MHTSTAGGRAAAGGFGAGHRAGGARGWARTGLAAMVAATGLVAMAIIPAPALAAGPDRGSGTAMDHTAPADPNAPPMLRFRCRWQQLINNGSFEQPAIGSVPNNGNWADVQGGTTPVAWHTNDPQNDVELWNARMGVAPYDGAQLAELDANALDTMYQDIRTVPNTLLFWRFAHRARSVSPAVDVDTMQLVLAPTIGVGPHAITPATSVDTAWQVSSGWYRVPFGQMWTRVDLQALSSAGGPSYGNLIDDVEVFGFACR